MSNPVHIVCPHCDTVNRVPAAKLAGGGRCGECHRALFEGRSVALDEARLKRHLDKSDVPVLIDFWASWCGPCRMMAPELERAAQRLEPQLRIVKVNIDEAPTAASRFHIQSVPTLALTLHGREIARTAGAMSAAALEQWARRHHAA